jgi:ADP-heptose:LPS heptosyltransferase
LRALRAALPHAHITLIGLPWAGGFAERFRDYLDGFIAFPGAPGLPERVPGPGEFEAFLVLARARCFDLALQLHGSGGQSNPVTLSLDARLNAGFFLAGGDCPDVERFLPYPEHEPEVRRLLRLLQFLGVPLQGEGLEFPLLAADFQALNTVTRTLDQSLVDYVCIHPGARAAARRWPAERFATVADGLAAAGLPVVLTGTEAALTSAVAQAMIAPCIDLAGRTSLGAMAALISRARLLVCNDTGVSHIAAALRVPSVVIYTASSPQRWAPANQVRHRRVFVEVECRPCEYEECPIGHPCAVGVTAEQVLDQALQILAKTERAAARA